MPGSPLSQVHSAMVGEFNWQEFVVSCKELPHKRCLRPMILRLPMVAGIQLLRLWVSSTGPTMETPPRAVWMSGLTIQQDRQVTSTI